MKLKDNAGFSLVELLVAMAILGLITVPVLSGMVVAMRTMSRTEQILKAQLEVSSAVETLLAQGITEEFADCTDKEFGNVLITTVQATEKGEDLPYYYVTVTSVTEDALKVTTTIREAGGQP